LKQDFRRGAGIAARKSRSSLMLLNRQDAFVILSFERNVYGEDDDDNSKIMVGFVDVGRLSKWKVG
jgi:hypothetical protein